jgi:hypothetical protein
MRYFFDTFDGYHWAQDDTGFEANYLEAAHKMTGGACRYGRGNLPDGRFVDLAVGSERLTLERG